MMYLNYIIMIFFFYIKSLSNCLIEQKNVKSHIDRRTINIINRHQIQKQRNDIITISINIFIERENIGKL